MVDATAARLATVPPFADELTAVYIIYLAVYLSLLASYAWSTHVNKSNFYVAARQPQLLLIELTINAFISTIFGETTDCGCIPLWMLLYLPLLVYRALLGYI